MSEWQNRLGTVRIATMVIVLAVLGIFWFGGIRTSLINASAATNSRG
jgi:hypothetical protein